MSIVLQACGLVAVVLAGWRSYATARDAVLPLAHDGDPTRTAIESARPLPLRPRVRRFARHATLALGWLLVCFYGLYLFAAGQEIAR